MANHPQGYIHFTSSGILPLLPKTDYALQSVKDLLLKYKVAPFSGEIFSGGMMGAILNPGTTSFADLDEVINDKSYWTYESISRRGLNCAKRTMNPMTAKDLKNFFLEHFQPQYLAYSLNEGLVYLLRMRQLRQLPFVDPREREALLGTFDKHIQAIKNKYLFNYLLARAVRKNGPGLLKQENLDLINRLERSLIAEDYALITNEIAKPSKDASKILQLIKNRMLDTDFEKAFDVKDYFEDRSIANESKEEADDCQYIIDTFCLLPTRTDFSLQVTLTKNFDPSYLLKTLPKVFEELEGLQNGYHDLLDPYKEACEPTHEQNQKFLDNHFPIAFITRPDVELERSKYEFRSNRPLFLGKEVNCIVVPTEQVETVKNLLPKEIQDKVSIRTFTELEASLATKSKFIFPQVPEYPKPGLRVLSNSGMFSFNLAPVNHEQKPYNQSPQAGFR